MIQDITPHIFNNQYVPLRQCLPNDLLFCVKNNRLMLLGTETEPELPKFKDLPSVNFENPVYLFSLNGQNCFWVKEISEIDTAKFVFEEINFFRTLKKKEIAWVCIVGTQLISWYMQNRFCGSCGNPTEIKNHERAIACTKCDNVVYPKISPAVIVAITSGNKILLARGKNFRSGFYSLVAGYADIGESLEDAVLREVKEEVGIDVKNIRYYKSQPWPFSGSMMIGYWADADANQPIEIDPNEISEAAWFTRGNLPAYPTNISIAGEMIGKFESGTY